MNILYEDNHLLVVEKPVNLPVQADASGDPDLLGTLKAYVKERYNKPGEAYLGLVHRLDRPVGGVMVFARTSKAAARLSEQFRSHKAKKRYVAVVEGCPKPSDSLCDFLVKDERTNTSRVVPAGTAGAKEARLQYRCLAREGGLALLDVSLDTGRPHQIRVQLAHAGLPILGDQRYNKAAAAGTQIRLFAYALTLTHPTLGEPLRFFARPNWAEFALQLRFLPASEVCSAVFMDERLLIVDKQAGVEVEGELMAELSAVESELWPVHRLDANTEGLVAFARSEAARDALLEAFRLHETEKSYEAVVVGAPKEAAARLCHYAVKDEAAGRMRLCPKGTAGAVTMELAYRVREERNGLSLLEICLFTGRTHQIRVQLAAIGCPVLGDDVYGDREANKRYGQRRQLLLAKRLTVLGVSAESQKALSLPELQNAKAGAAR